MYHRLALRCVATRCTQIFWVLPRVVGERFSSPKTAYSQVTKRAYFPLNPTFLLTGDWIASERPVWRNMLHHQRKEMQLRAFAALVIAAPAKVGFVRRLFESSRKFSELWTLLDSVAQIS